MCGTHSDSRLQRVFWPVWTTPTLSLGKRVVYLGRTSGTIISHVADIVGPEGLVCAAGFSHRLWPQFDPGCLSYSQVSNVCWHGRCDPWRCCSTGPGSYHWNRRSPLRKYNGHITISIKASCIRCTLLQWSGLFVLQLWISLSILSVRSPCRPVILVLTSQPFRLCHQNRRVTDDTTSPLR